MTSPSKPTISFQDLQGELNLQSNLNLLTNAHTDKAVMALLLVTWRLYRVHLLINMDWSASWICISVLYNNDDLIQKIKEWISIKGEESIYFTIYTYAMHLLCKRLSKQRLREYEA